ncbi:MAG: ABC transporter permease [Clostridiales Family XIII bacterium]|jgi:NitT/TauT family transport system permease protein|nr:ABC transporter permease [Clostridiales Family XIII bacterium]
MNKTRLPAFVSALAGAAVLLLLWHLGSLALNKPFLPTPAASFEAFFRLSLSGGMAMHFALSAARVLAGTAIALVAAVPTGIFLSSGSAAAQACRPVIAMLYPIPKVVFLPVFIVLLGLGNTPKILLVSVVIFFQIAVVTRDAAASIPPASMLSMRSLHAGRLQILRHLVLPYCFPQILTSLRVTTGTAIAVLFFAETFASFDGLGYFILEGMETREYAAMYAGIIGMALLGLLFYAAIGAVERIFCRWRH